MTPERQARKAASFVRAIDKLWLGNAYIIGTFYLGLPAETVVAMVGLKASELGLVAEYGPYVPH